MVRKIQFSQEDVIQAAFLVVKNRGIDQLTARNVAHELGSSTAPVYSNFANMEDLESAAFAKATEKLLEYATRPHTDNPFLNIGIGVLEFAWDCPLWYYAFSVKHSQGHDHFLRLSEKFLERMAEIPEMEPIRPPERAILLHKMAIFTHGLAWDICQGNFPHDGLPSGFQLMEEVGNILTKDALERPARSEEEYEKLAWICHPTQPPSTKPGD